MIAGRDKVIPFKIILRDRFQDNFQHKDVPLVEVLPAPVSVDHVIAFVGPAPAQRSRSQADQVLVDVHVGKASHDDPFPSNHQDKSSTDLVTRESCKRQLS